MPMRRKRDRLKTGLLLASALGFAVLGQFYFVKRREYVWDGIIFFGLALVCFAWLIATAARTIGMSRPEPATPWQERGHQILANRRTILVALALVFNLIAARSANATPAPSDYTLSIGFWLASLVLLFATFVSLPHLVASTQQAIRNTQYMLRHDHRYALELAFVTGLIVIGLLLRILDLEHIPANLSGDEGTQGMWALNVLEGRLRNPFATGWFTVPTMSFFVQAASLRLFGDSVAGLRTVSALIGTVTLAITYLFAHRNLGRRVALFALAALTFSHYHIHYSRLGSNQIADPFFMLLALLLLTEGLRRTKNQKQGAINDSRRATRNTPHVVLQANAWFLGAGLAIGLSWYGYFGSRVIVLVVAAHLVTQAILDRGFLQRNVYPLMLMTVIALMAVSPLLLYYSDFPANFNARFNQVNVFRWLANELARPDHDSVLSLVVRQIWRSISAFNYTLDPTFWYRAQIPLLDFVSGILFVLGLAVAINHWRRSVTRLVLLWFVSAIILGWMLTENPPSSMRMLIITPALALLVALGLDRLLVLAHWAIGGSRQQWNWLAVPLLAVAALLNVHYYFVVYTPTRVYGNPTAETATVLARYLRDGSGTGPHALNSETDEFRDDQRFVYFYGPPFLYYDFGTVQFISHNVPGVDVPPKGQDPGFRPRILGPTLFIVLSERLDELAAVQAQHPYGQLHEFYSEADGRLMFVIYEVLP
jgi:4-amino-4-deoxy-L-arabinose transferase-like glycosyltransferase